MGGSTSEGRARAHTPLNTRVEHTRSARNAASGQGSHCAGRRWDTVVAWPCCAPEAAAVLGATRGAHCATAFVFGLAQPWRAHSALVRSSCAAAVAATRVRSALATAAALICARAAAAFTRDFHSLVRPQPRARAHRRPARKQPRLYGARATERAPHALSPPPLAFPRECPPLCRCYGCRACAATAPSIARFNRRRRVPPSIAVIGYSCAVDNAATPARPPSAIVWRDSTRTLPPIIGAAQIPGRCSSGLLFADGAGILPSSSTRTAHAPPRLPPLPARSAIHKNPRPT